MSFINKRNYKKGHSSYRNHDESPNLPALASQSYNKHKKGEKLGRSNETMKIQQYGRIQVVVVEKRRQ